MGAYYYWNARTNETTWEFPGSTGSSSTAGPSTSAATALGPETPGVDAPDHADGAPNTTVDSDLAFLEPTYDPALAASRGAAAYGALWAHSRAGERAPGRDAMENDKLYDPSQLVQPADPSHDGALHRSSHAPHRHPTKKEVRAFQARKKARKAAQYAWLRD